MFSLKSFLFSGCFPSLHIPPTNPWPLTEVTERSCFGVLCLSYGKPIVHGPWRGSNIIVPLSPVLVTAHEVELNIIFSVCISLAFILSGLTQELRALLWSHSVSSFQSGARDIITGARNLLSAQGCLYWSKIFFHYDLLFPKLLRWEGLSSYT